MGMLEGITVIELTTAGSAPICGKILAENGARVIMVEDTRKGTSTRHMLMYDFFHMNKESIAVNLKTQDGQEIMHHLLSKADIFLSNFRKKALERLHLDDQTLMEKYPRLIYGLLTGYGEKGPVKDDPGFDVTAFWGRGGVEYTMQEKECPGGIVPPSSVGDNCTGSILYGGLMTALYNRERTGKGMKVSISLLGTGVWLNNNQMIWAQNGVDYPRSRKTPLRALMNSYSCKDGTFNILIQNFDRDFPKLLRVIGREDLIGDPRWKTLGDTEREHAPELRQILDDGFAGMTLKEVREAFGREDLALGILHSPQEVISDPQVLENGYVRKHEASYPEQDSEFYIACNPVTYDDSRDTLWGRAPAWGENTREILDEVGYDQQQVDRMLNENIVRSSH